MKTLSEIEPATEEFSLPPRPEAKARVVHVITKLELGGAQKVTLMTLERLPRDRYELVLVSGTEGLLKETAEAIPGLGCAWLPDLVREVRPVRDIRALAALWRLFRELRPDIVHTHSSKAGILGRWSAWLAGVPIVFHTAHGFGFNDYQSALTRTLYVWIERITGRITTRSVVVSRANAERAERLGILQPREWVLCRDSIAVEEFLQEPGTRSRIQEIPPDRKVVGMVACFKPQKSPVDFVDLAWSVLKQRGDVHFVIAGDGELRAQVETRIAEHGIQDHVTLLGWRTDMPEVYGSLDIFVLTSLWEGQPCVYAEAMASGLPIVATNVDGATEAIADGVSGFLHPRHDVEAMAESVIRLLDDPGLRRSMGEAGRSKVREFDIEQSVASLEAAYRECLARRAAGQVLSHV